MSDLSPEARNSVALQVEMFRRAAKEYGLSVTVLKGRTLASDTTLRGWARGEHQMPAWALGELGIPPELASLVLDPFNRHVGINERGDGDLDELGREAASFVSDKLDREADGVICHIDKAVLKSRAARIAVKARAAAA